MILKINDAMSCLADLPRWLVNSVCEWTPLEGDVPTTAAAYGVLIVHTAREGDPLNAVLVASAAEWIGELTGDQWRKVVSVGTNWITAAAAILARQTSGARSADVVGAMVLRDNVECLRRVLGMRAADRRGTVLTALDVRVAAVDDRYRAWASRLVLPVSDSSFDIAQLRATAAAEGERAWWAWPARSGAIVPTTCDSM